MTTSQQLDVLAVGNAIVDVLVHCVESLLDKLDLPKGTMSLLDASRAGEIYAVLGAGVEISGGSAANTAVGVASFGGRSAFVGKVSDDELGRIFGHDLRATGVAYDVPPATSGPETGRCLVMVTPDAQRTMATYLGIAGEISAGDVDTDLVARSRITFIEGYLVGLPRAAPAIRTAVRAAHEAGRKVALTLSDPGWVKAQHDALSSLVDNVDILLANEAEACELTGERDVAAAISTLAGSCPVVAVTCGERGAYLSAAGQTTAIPAHPVSNVVDTTGAGDLFAAGFLLGVARDLPLIECGRMAALAAAEVISHLGARPEASLADLARAAEPTLTPTP